MSKITSIRSTEYFLHKLRSIENINLDVFKELFASYRDYLAAGLGFYRPFKSKPNDKGNLMKDAGLDETAANFIMEISEVLDLDYYQTYDLWCSYLLFDYAGPTRDVKTLIADSANRKSLILEMDNYFRREQISLLLSMIEILKLIQRPHDQVPPYVAIVESFIFDKLANPAFVDSILISLNEVWTKQIEEKKLIFGLRLDTSITARHYFTLQEHLISILIWLFFVSELPVDCYVGVLKLFSDQNFGRKQYYKKSLPVYESNACIERIFNLEILFALKAFRLESLLMAYSTDETRDKDSFWLNETLARKVGSMLDSLISSTSHDHAGLALGYTLNVQLRHWIKLRETSGSSTSNAAIDEDVQKFGSIAKRNNCLKFCHQFLSSSAIVEDSDLKSLARSVIYVALDGCLQFFEADSLGSADDLILIFCDVLRDTSVSEAFWSKNFSSGASNYVLHEIVYQFYASFERPLRILGALADASVESCRKVIMLCQKLPMFCEPAERIDEHELAVVDDAEDMQDEKNQSTALVLMKQRQPFGADGPLLPVGTRGRLIKGLNGVEEFVQWEFSYNAWQLCLLEITNAQTNSNRISSVLNLIGDVMKTDSSSINLFVHFLNEAIGLLKRSRYFDADLLVSVLEPCFRCLATAAKTFPYEVLAQLGNDDILPNLNPLSQEDFRLSLISRILNDVERLSGLYGCTIAFLQLMESCSDEIACYEHPSFVGSISYICDSMFSDCLSWPHENAQHKNEIAKLCLRICRKVLEKSTAVGNGNQAAIKKVVDICRSALTYGEARRVLLRLICIGLDALKDPYDSIENGRDREEIVSLSLATLLELLIDFEKTKSDGSLASQIFVDLFLAMNSSANVGAEPPLCSIGRYLFIRTNDRIPKLAIICLKKIAKIFPATILSTFGEWTSAFCDVFLTRLESPTEDVQLKIYCIEFLMVAIECQPGLAEQLLGVAGIADDTAGGDSNKTTVNNGGALNCILSLMKNDRMLPDLMIACVNLLSTIWRTNNQASMDYLRKDEFWPILLAPISAGEDNYFPTIVSPIFRILTQELFTNSVVKLKSVNGNTNEKSSGGSLKIVETIVQEIMEAERLKLIFKKMQEYCQSRIDFKDKLDVLGAWSDFLQMAFASKTIGGALDDGKREILIGSVNVLKIALNNFEQSGGIAVVKSASDLCSLAVKYCHKTDSHHGQQKNIKEFEAIFDRLNDAHVEEWTLHLCAIVLPSCSSIFRCSKLNREDADVLPLIFDTLCSILVKILIQTATLRTKNLLDSQNYQWQKALQSSLHCLSSMYNHSATIGAKRFLDILQKHSILRNLRVLVAALLDANHLNADLFSSVCLLFELAAKSPESLSIIRHSGFLEWICVNLVVAPEAITYDMDILTAVFTVHVSILEIGAHRVVSECITFLASYSDIVDKLLSTLLTSPTTKHAKVVARILQLLILLADYKDRWHFEASESQRIMIEAVSLLLHRIPPYLAKPAALAAIISKGEDKKLETSIGTSVDPKLIFMQQQLIEMLFLGVQFLLRFSPELMDVCNNPSFDVKSFRLLLALDLNTNISLDALPVKKTDGNENENFSPTLAFGSILLMVHLCVISLRKSETVKSASPSAHRAAAPPLLTSGGDKAVIAALLDSALYFILSQAMLNIRRGDALDSWQRTLLKRDLAAELSQYLSRCGIKTSGGSAPSTPRKSPTPIFPSSPGGAIRTTTTTGGFDYQFLKFVSDFVRDVLRNND